MKNLYVSAIALLCCLFLGFGCSSENTATSSAQRSDQPIPHFEKKGNVTQLIVKGEPFLALAGELHNSSSSSTEYMKSIWPRLKATGLNTVLAVISWEQVEPVEGTFDFSTVDDLIRDAKANDMKVVMLWFGSWKNGITSYVPKWVLADTKRFPLIQTKDGKNLNILSTLGEESAKADAKAYGAVMKHIREIDKDQTVIMIQVENEVGMHGYTRDYRPEAVAAFEADVPAELMQYLVKNKEKLLPELQDAWNAAGGKTSGNWETVFGVGDYTDELFMAWNYARYLNTVAAAGKAEYPVPTFVNTWIVQPQDNHPGDYPSGGPQAQNHDIWRAGAPNIDMLSPDIYLPDFPGILTMYSRSGNPVFVPESAAGANGAANAVYTVGEKGGIGYSPFGIESRGYVSSNTGIVTSADASTDIQPFTFTYLQLQSMASEILKHQAAGTIHAAWLRGTEETFEMGKYRVRAAMRGGRGGGSGMSGMSNIGYALIMMDAEDQFTIMGSGVEITFTPVDGKSIAGLAKVQEGDFVNNEWVAERWLNGDEIQLRYDLLQALEEGLSGQGLRFGTGNNKLQRVWLYNY